MQCGCILQAAQGCGPAPLQHADRRWAGRLGGCPYLEEICASFCSRLSDEGVEQLVAAAGPHLRGLELYHVPQLTAVAVEAVAAGCPNLEWLNLGKCGALRELAGRHGFLVQACHYLDY